MANLLYILLLYIYIYTYMYIYTYIYGYMCVHTHTYIHIYLLRTKLGFMRDYFRDMLTVQLSRFYNLDHWWVTDSPRALRTVESHLYTIPFVLRRANTSRGHMKTSATQYILLPTKIVYCVVQFTYYSVSLERSNAPQKLNFLIHEIFFYPDQIKRLF